MVDIPLQDIKDMPCYDQNIACYALSQNRRYEMLFAGSWGFEYREEASANKVGERIKSRAVLSMNYLKRYHGIEITVKHVKKDEDFIEILYKETNLGHPVMVFLSCYYYPWNEHYHSFDNQIIHAFFVVGVDKEKQCLYCFDNMFDQKNTKMTFEDFLNGNNGKYWAFQCLPEYTKEVDVEELIQYTIRKLKRDTNQWADIEDIRRLAGAMKENFDLKVEMDGTHGGIWVEPILFNIGGIIEDRLDYKRLLNYILEQKKDALLLYVVNQLENVKKTWEQIHGMIVKGHYLENPKSLIERVIQKVEEVANLEEEAAKRLEQWPGLRNDRNEKEIMDIEYLPMENYYNNQCFGIYTDEESVVSLEDKRQVLFVNERAKEKVWKLRTMEFFHEPITGREQDSIRCEGQIIRADSKKHDCILLMGYAEIENLEEEMEVEYGDKTWQTIPIQFPHVIIPNPWMKSSMIWSGRCGFVGDMEEHTWEAGMYAKVYHLQKKTIKNLKLPNCPHAVIQAISLGNYEMHKEESI